jgi:hypothetical protein
MIFQLMSPWPTSGGSVVVPVGAVITGSAPPIWGGMSLPTPLPIDSKPMDSAALTAMQTWYPLPELQRWFSPKGF